MKTLKEATKILVAGDGKAPYPRVSSSRQWSATSFCVCGRPQPKGEQSRRVEDATHWHVDRLERELEELALKRTELAREIGKVMAREKEARRELKKLVGD